MASTIFFVILLATINTFVNSNTVTPQNSLENQIKNLEEQIKQAKSSYEAAYRNATYEIYKAQGYLDLSESLRRTRGWPIDQKAVKSSQKQLDRLNGYHEYQLTLIENEIMELHRKKIDLKKKLNDVLLENAENVEKKKKIFYEKEKEKVKKKHWNATAYLDYYIQMEKQFHVDVENIKKGIKRDIEYWEGKYNEAVKIFEQNMAESSRNLLKVKNELNERLTKDITDEKKALKDLYFSMKNKHRLDNYNRLSIINRTTQDVDEMINEIHLKEYEVPLKEAYAAYEKILNEMAIEIPEALEDIKLKRKNRGLNSNYFAKAEKELNERRENCRKNLLFYKEKINDLNNIIAKKKEELAKKSE